MEREKKVWKSMQQCPVHTDIYFQYKISVSLGSVAKNVNFLFKYSLKCIFKWKKGDKRDISAIEKVERNETLSMEVVNVG